MNCLKWQIRCTTEFNIFSICDFTNKKWKFLLEKYLIFRFSDRNKTFLEILLSFWKKMFKFNAIDFKYLSVQLLKTVIWYVFRLYLFHFLISIAVEENYCYYFKKGDVNLYYCSKDLEKVMLLQYLLLWPDLLSVTTLSLHLTKITGF